MTKFEAYVVPDFLREHLDCRDIHKHRGEVNEVAVAVHLGVVPVGIAPVKFPDAGTRTGNVNARRFCVLAVGGIVVFVVVYPEMQHLLLFSLGLVPVAYRTIAVVVWYELRIVKDIQCGRQTAGDIATAEATVTLSCTFVDMRCQQSIFIVRNPPITHHDFIPLATSVGIARESRARRQAIQLRQPAIPRRPVIVVPVTVEPAHGKPVRVAFPHLESSRVRGIGPAHAYLPHARVVRAKPLYRHLPGRIVAIYVEFDLPELVNGRCLSAVGGVVRIGAICDLDAVRDSVPVAVGKIRISPVQILVYVRQAVVVGIAVSPIAPRGVLRVKAVVIFPSVRHSVSVHVWIKRVVVRIRFLLVGHAVAIRIRHKRICVMCQKLRRIRKPVAIAVCISWIASGRLLLQIGEAVTIGINIGLAVARRRERIEAIGNLPTVHKAVTVGVRAV